MFMLTIRYLPGEKVVKGGVMKHLLLLLELTAIRYKEIGFLPHSICDFPSPMLHGLFTFP